MNVTPTDLVTALRDWGCTVRVYEPDGRPWHTHTTAGGWAPQGVAHHHTGGGSKVLTSAATQEAMRRLLRFGRPDLDGPLCHAAPTLVPGDPSRAEVHLIGWGNVNHAGNGCAAVARLIRAGAYDGRAPGPDLVDGNSLLWALEYLHPGLDSDGRPIRDWPEALLDQGHRAAAAMCEVSGWPRGEWAGRQVEHRQWTRRKPDRAWARDARGPVAELARLGQPPPSTPPPTPDQMEDDEMAIELRKCGQGYYVLQGALLTKVSSLSHLGEIRKLIADQLGVPASVVERTTVKDIPQSMAAAALPSMVDMARLQAQVAVLQAPAGATPEQVEAIATAAARAVLAELGDAFDDVSADQ